MNKSGFALPLYDVSFNSSLRSKTWGKKKSTISCCSSFIILKKNKTTTCICYSAVALCCTATSGSIFWSFPTSCLSWIALQQRSTRCFPEKQPYDSFWLSYRKLKLKSDNCYENNDQLCTQQSRINDINLKVVPDEFLSRITFNYFIKHCPLTFIQRRLCSSWLVSIIILKQMYKSNGVGSIFALSECCFV